ncbi:RCC1 domain-containing protein [Paraliomyxa miuraensis]|uniref:RCC1 domain-containing protein n=1 Tax=Paraliomyxa miuraensis TaxID=376150 RepID=UPI002257D395|nr:DUF4215 domain-containing protein [Paraliomyxa miuraensis]MCX4240503.1 DUF4215 domain-containing protein [Paraliomyxa miuraensis]
MHFRSWISIFLSGSTLALAACGDDATVVPPDGTSTGEPASTTAPGTTTDGSTSEDPDSTGMAPGCGDGLRAEGEDCDDGNSDDLDGCSSMCVIEDGWLCNGQPSECFAVCGDGIIVGEEGCDDDNLLDDDGCTVECVLEPGWACEGEPSECATVCGDSMIVGDEECDDTNTDEGDGCDAACQDEQGWNCVGEPSECATVCGDGMILGAEECDDFDAMAGDGCSDTCAVELGWACGGEPSMCMTGCGDGITAGMEQCDDLNLDDFDGCSAACVVESGWMCMGDPSVCITDCGDGITAGTETCDDGGIVAGDGCDALCQTDPGWICVGEPSVCATDCGDGLVVGTETCDDGGIGQGDGCNEICAVDFGWDCVGEPSVCVETAFVVDMSLGYSSGCVITNLGDVGCFGDNVNSEVGNGTILETFLPVFVLSDAIAVASGEYHNCALRAGGSVWCWGDNLESQMGPLSTPPTDESTPIEITGLPPIVAIDSGDDHICALDGLGQVWCWGDNLNRQLGHGGATTTDSAIPQVVPMPGGLTVIDLGLGDDHSCVVLEDNTVACWGDDDNGQLGDGVAGTDSGDAFVVPGLAVVNDVEGGQDNACALTDLGEVYCWGDNIDGQLGVGNTVDNPAPLLVTLPSAAEQISLGDDFACALLYTDQIFCWGESEGFQTGYGDLIDALVPTEVQQLPPGDIVDIEAAGRGVCVLMATSDRWCWGHSEEGQLGIAPLNQLEPSPVAFSGPVAQVRLEEFELDDGMICGVMVDGTLECAGDGTLVSVSTITGAAGFLEPIKGHVTTPTTHPLVTDVQDAGMGDGFMCVRTSTNVQCWGDNAGRQLGQGGTSTTDILTPVPVMGLGAVDELAVGDAHVCVRTGGTVQCWGDNISYQTGEPSSTTDQSLPVTVMGIADAIQITAGEGHNCVLRSTGAVSCWGDDASGQLGDDDGDTTDSGIPVDVVGLPAVVDFIDAGQDHTCALAGGEVYCWGEGQYGNLGQGNETDSDMALVVPGLAGIVQIAVGRNYACARDGAGDMWCWGDSADGELGDGGMDLTGLIEVRSPTPFAVASGIMDVVAGNTVTCVQTAAGWGCVGFRSAGHLGNGTTVLPSRPTNTMFGL